jgi:hypothetical protein
MPIHPIPIYQPPPSAAPAAPTLSCPLTSPRSSRTHGLEVEPRQAQDRIRHLEQALKTAGRVLQPYLAGNGR